MADGFTIDVDATAVKAALAKLGDTAVLFTKPASFVTALSMQSEARSRVARATGKTADNILVTETEDGYLVHTADVRIDRSPIPGSTKEGAEYFHEKHVGLWLEKGTSLGARRSHASAPRPFFFVSAQLEEGPHERRIAEALQEAIDQEGLGD